MAEHLAYNEVVVRSTRTRGTDKTLGSNIMPLPPRPSRPEEPEHINMPQQPNLPIQQQPNQLTQENTILQCFDRIKYMIPDYEWTCFYHNGDLIHVPTEVILSSEQQGYYIIVPQVTNVRNGITSPPPITYTVRIDIQDIHNENTEPFTTDPREAVREWFTYVMKRLANTDLGNP